MKQNEDRRVRRTRRLLRQALAELLQEKEFKDITVTDVVARADINRGTFYAHYRDVYDLREKVENEMVEDFRCMVQNGQLVATGLALRSVLMRAIDYVEKNRMMVRTLLKSSGTQSFERKLMHIIEQCHLQAAGSDAAERYVGRFLAAGILGGLGMWLDEEAAVPKEKLVELMSDLLAGVVGKGCSNQCCI